MKKTKEIAKVLFPIVGLAACSMPRNSSENAAENPVVHEIRDVDLLFVVDNSGSMADERKRLAEELPLFVTSLLSGDLNRDGRAEFRGVESLQVGIVTSDMGNGLNSGGCTREGDDALLQTAVDEEDPSCVLATDSFLRISQGEDPEDFAHQIGCRVRGVAEARHGGRGCGLEQPLEAMLKTLSPAEATAWTRPGYRSPDFVHGPGHGLDGMVRPNSMLIVVQVSEEEDSSTLNPNSSFDLGATCSGGADEWCVATPNGDELVNPGIRSAVFGPELPFERANAFTPVSRYVEGLLALRKNPADLLYLSIVGMPTSQDIGSPTIDAVLEEPRMNYEYCPDLASLLSVCGAPITDGLAYPCTIGTGAVPGRRFLQVAQGLHASGAHALVGSICESDALGKLNYEGVFEATMRVVSKRIGD